MHDVCVNGPTIFSSWAQVHPRVTGCKGAHHQGFDTLEDARSSLQDRGSSEFSADVLSNSTSATSTRGPKNFYAVAYGRTSGIFEDYRDV
ncbi:RNase H1/viroplasmin domain-containing protein, partial [Aspergillus lucknowensis]